MMKKLPVLSLLFFSLYGFGQILNFPTVSSPYNTIQNYSNQNYSNPVKTNTPSVPQSFYSGNGSKVDQQNMKMVQEDFKRVAQEQEVRVKQQEEARLQALDESIYNLPSLSGETGTEAYYDAYDQLASLNTENYSLSEANFIVENAYYGNKQNYHQFKSGLQKTARQLLQKMRERKQILKAIRIKT